MQLYPSLQYPSAAYATALGPIDLEPFAGLAYVNLSSDGVDESGGSAALRGKGDSADIVFQTLGLRAGHDLVLDTVKLKTGGSLGWRHAYGDTSPEAHLAFAQGSAGYAVQGSPVARDSLVLGAGAALDVLPRLAIGLDYTGELAHDAQDHGLMATVTFKF
ncbi:autotransporter outer membrane beta-barrel domain-containing protein [Arboricoccus pini]|uniref:autotransporter outer membrane beta-barrel domain-containing protein n=1 Tax=Arboricoccus pini TaxID=1963835 RepID=UPI0013FD5446|nr:autotransporter domain-containing protein [Arboricoccus pini]